MGDIAQAKGDGESVERVVLERQGFTVATHQFQRAVTSIPAQIEGPFAAGFQHTLIDIAEGYACVRAPLENAPGDIASAAGNVDNFHARLRAEAVDELGLPQPVHARAHEIVHQVVAVGDGIENGAHARGFLPHRHVFIAKIGGRAVLVCARVVHGCDHIGPSPFPAKENPRASSEKKPHWQPLRRDCAMQHRR